MLRKLSILFILGLITSCAENGPSDPLLQALSSTDPKIANVMQNLDAHEVQIRYTQIDRRNDSIIFTDYDFQVEKNNYFYPASTVKFPAAVAALEKLNEIDTLNAILPFLWKAILYKPHSQKPYRRFLRFRTMPPTTG